MVYCPSLSSLIAPPPSILQADACSSGGGAHCHCRHPLSAFLRNPLHEQLLEELGAGGVLSAVHTHDPPYEKWLVGVEHVREQWGRCFILPSFPIRGG
jgi:hypothetical protein